MTVRKTSKKEPAEPAAATHSDEERVETPTPESAPAGSSRKAAKAAKSPARKNAGKKKPTGSAKKRASKKSSGSASGDAQEPSEADIRLRAYFIAERRVQLALQGDPALDWIEARQQLIDEARQAKS